MQYTKLDNNTENQFFLFKQFIQKHKELLLYFTLFSLL